MDRPSILAFFDFFYPAVKSGGPARSSLGFAQVFSKKYDISIVTSNRDVNESEPFPNITPNKPTRVDGFLVYYLNSAGLGTIYKLLTKQPDYVYINSFFSIRFAIYPLQLVRAFRPKSKIVLAPRGEFAESALSKGRIKKKAYITLYKLAFEPRDISYQASSEFEKADILRELPGRPVIVSPNLRPISDLYQFAPTTIQKKKGELRVCLVARITPVKNILNAIKWVQVANQQGASVVFDIYGFKENEDYYSKCLEQANKSDGSVRLLAGVHASSVIPLIGQYHLFFMPTLGENFGHSILESLIAGRPVLISDQTPWRNLKDSFAGVELPLKGEFQANALIDFARMTEEEFSKWCIGARKLAEGFFLQQQNSNEVFRLFS